MANQVIRGVELAVLPTTASREGGGLETESIVGTSDVGNRAYVVKPP